MEMVEVVIFKKSYVIVGFNPQNKSIINSIDRQSNEVFLFAKKDQKSSAYAKKEGLTLVDFSFSDDICKVFLNTFQNLCDKRVEVVVNSGDDDLNQKYAKAFCDLAAGCDLAKFSQDDSKGLIVYVFCEAENAADTFAKGAMCNVRIVNKHKLIASDFVDRFPLTRYMTAEHIDYSTATIKSNAAMNVFLIGFDTLSQHIFLTSVASQQFLTVTDGNRVQKDVNYFIYDKRADAEKKSANKENVLFDKTDSLSAKNDSLSNSFSNNMGLYKRYLRYDKVLNADKSAYLPLPQRPANEAFCTAEIGSMQFFAELKKQLVGSENMLSYNHVVVAFGTATENIKLAKDISAKLVEWGVAEKTRIFLKGQSISASDEKGYADSSVFSMAKEGDVAVFGDEAEVVYSISQIVGEKSENMALDRHLCYALTAGMSAEDEKAATSLALEKWYSQTQLQRESNVYACLGIRTKLNLLGFDFCEISESRADARDAFQAIYEKGDPIVYGSAEKSVKGRREIVYTNDFVEGSIRQTFAMQEHQRWNAYMIACGIVPSTLKQIEAGEFKNLDEGLHGNITTFDGLVTFRKIAAKLKGRSEEDTDVIRYDYQIMDDLVWLLSNSGYKIVRK